MFTPHGWQASTAVDLPSIIGGGLAGDWLARPVRGHSRSPLIVSHLVPTSQFPLPHTALPGGPKVTNGCTDATFLVLDWVFPM